MKRTLIVSPLLTLASLLLLTTCRTAPALPPPRPVRTVQVIFHSDPPGARLVLHYDAGSMGGIPLGNADRAISLSLPVGPNLLIVDYHMDGFKDASESYPLDVEDRNTPINAPLVHLHPLTATATVRQLFSRNPTAYIIVFVLLTVGLIGSARHIREVRRRARFERRLTELCVTEDPPDSNIGRRIGRWRLLQFIGGGGTARVYRGCAQDHLALRDDEPVAIKLLDPRMLDGLGSVERFRREVNLYRTLSHASLVHLIDWGEDEGLYLVMELVEGRTLRQYVQPGGLPLDTVLAYARDIGNGLAYAHARDIVHRDMKPSNVMVTPQGRARIMDFGLAWSPGTALTSKNVIIGTPAYMAPEQLRGQAVGPATDQYAFGIIMYELLTGANPYAGATVVAAMERQASPHPLPPLATGRAGLGDLEAVILRMTALDPAARFETVLDALRALEAAISEASPRGEK